MRRRIDREHRYQRTPPKTTGQTRRAIGPLPMTPIEEPGKGHKIDWLNRPGTVPRTWNPIIGCRRVSAGCDHCYAHRMARRLAAMAEADAKRGKEPGRKIHYKLVEAWDGSTVTIRHALDDPAAWSKPATVFVGSMGDLFCASVSDRDRGWVWQSMARHPQHTFLMLTKRPHRAAEFLRDREVLPNLWLGTSIEDQAAADARLPHLAACRAAIRFVSCEPLIGPVSLAGFYPAGPDFQYTPIDCVDWIICGGEKGPGSRPMAEEWAAALQIQAAAAGVPFFFKQWGDGHKGRPAQLEGKEYRQWPNL